MGIDAALGHALATAPRIRMVVADPNGGEDITGEIIRSVSETHVTFRADDGLEFTLPTAGLRVLAAVRVPGAEERAS